MPSPFLPSAAARYLLARQSFSIGFGKSHPYYFKDSTMVRGFTVLAIGNNLFETLVLNLLPYSCDSDKPMACQKDKAHNSLDLPTWEQSQPEQPDEKGTRVKGYLDYLTWQSRRIHLVPEENSPTIQFCQLQQNLALADEPVVFDPFKCYRQDEKAGWVPLSLNPNRALWRDSHILFQRVDKSKKRPEIFNHLAQVKLAQSRGEIEGQFAYSFAAYGFATEINKAASVVFWSRERLPLPLSYLTEPQLVEALEEALKLAETFSQQVRDAVQYLAKLLLAPLSDSREARQPDSKDVNNLAATFNSQEYYWSVLETHFKKLLTDLPLAFQHQRASESQQENKPMSEWARTLDRTADDAFKQAINSLSGSPLELKAATIAQEKFRKQLGKTRKDNPDLFPAKQIKGGE